MVVLVTLSLDEAVCIIWSPPKTSLPHYLLHIGQFRHHRQPSEYLLNTFSSTLLFVLLNESEGKLKRAHNLLIQQDFRFGNCHVKPPDLWQKNCISYHWDALILLLCDYQNCRWNKSQIFQGVVIVFVSKNLWLQDWDIVICSSSILFIINIECLNSENPVIDEDYSIELVLQRTFLGKLVISLTSPVPPSVRFICTKRRTWLGYIWRRKISRSWT